MTDKQDSPQAATAPTQQTKPQHPPYLVFGLDLGSGSIGWCVLDRANGRVIALNTLIFPVPQAAKTKESLAAKRSEYKRHRRTLNHKQGVKTRCLEILAAHGLIEAPLNSEGDVSLKVGGSMMQPRKGERGPLRCRVRGLDRRLSDRELARVIYSLCNHRGYIDHGDGDLDGDASGKKVLTALQENERIMREEGYRTVGEMLVKHAAKTGSLARSRNKSGDYALCVTNVQICDELRTLLECQRAFGNEKASEELYDEIVSRCLTYLTDCSEQERRTYKRVSQCIYHPEEKAAPAACLSSEMTNAYERLRNIRIVEALNDKGAALSDAVVKECIARIFSTKPRKGKAKILTYAQLRKMLDLPAACHFKGVKQGDETKREVYAPKAWNALRAKLPEPLLLKMKENRPLADAIACALVYSSSKATLCGILEGDADVPIPAVYLEPLADLTDEEVEVIGSLPNASKVFSGYGTRSLRSLDMILSEFASGAASLAEIEDNLGLYKARTDKGEPGDFLPPYLEFDPQCTNPVVLRAMANARRVVNALIKRYGRPAEIHVEVAAELKKSKRARAKIEKVQNARKKANAARAEIAAGILGCDPASVPGKTLLKMELYEQQGDKDVYTGEPIDLARLVTDKQYAQVDHVIPYSRSYDDSRANKVLVLAKTNQDKGNRTPCEWLGEGAAWDALQARLAAMDSIPMRKKALILCTDVAAETEGFKARNLNDTRYMTRRCAEWLGESLIFADGVTEDGKPLKVHVKSPSGAITAKLRRFWGLSKKDREKDNLHHAVDAAVIAACTQSVIQRTANALSKKHMVRAEAYEAAMRAAEPWPGFAAEVEALAAKAIPARAPHRRLNGAAFKETTYRMISPDNGEGKAILVTADKKPEPWGNCILNLNEGSGRKYGKMAFLQLWWDPQGKAKGKKTPGRWLFDPVYYADMPAVRAKSYMPKSGTSKLGRNAWPEIPDRAKAVKPLRLFPGDMLEIKGELRLFVGCDVATCSWVLADARGDFSDEVLRSKASKGLGYTKCHYDDIKRVDVGHLGFPGEALEDER